MYRYQKFSLHDDTLLIRSTVHGQQKRGNTTTTFNAYAINEWCPRTPLASRWRAKLASGVFFSYLRSSYRIELLPSHRRHEEQQLQIVSLGCPSSPCWSRYCQGRLCLQKNHECRVCDYLVIGIDSFIERMVIISLAFKTIPLTHSPSKSC